MRFFYIMTVIVFITVILFFFYFFPTSRGLEISFLDVGQGDSILIEAPQGQNILIDGGPDKKVMYSLGSALPFWERRIDFMILTHSHADHVTGLISVLKRFEVGKVLYNGEKMESEIYKKFLQLAGKKSELVRIENKKVIKMDKNCELDIIPPSQEIKQIDNPNNASLVARFDCRGFSALFTGDIEKEREERMLFQNLNLNSNILKVSHHGSDTSSAQNFLKEVRPEVAVIQAGEENKKGHPSNRVIKRLERLGAKIFRNDKVGSIEFLFKEGKIQPIFLP